MKNACKSRTKHAEKEVTRTSRGGFIIYYMTARAATRLIMSLLMIRLKIKDNTSKEKHTFTLFLRCYYQLFSKTTLLTSCCRARTADIASYNIRNNVFFHLRTT
ncbi:unnamed protein product [Amoebophrya sp. A25]|nr:unnamed protein product [Amoebophrya sp. A25]|eukprot:GSA25T00011203001.1